jgi:hypothetical protein
MATVSSVGGLSPDVAQSIFQAVDRNGDQQVSLSEFTAFLNRLAGELTGAQTTGDTSSAATTIAKAAATTSTGYAPIQGFDFAKITDVAHVNGKYTEALRAFSQALYAGNLPPVSSSLASIVSYAQANGFPEAKTIGKDVINFGDGYGDVDVIVDVGGTNASWAFQASYERTA